MSKVEFNIHDKNNKDKSIKLTTSINDDWSEKEANIYKTGFMNAINKARNYPNDNGMTVSWSERKVDDN